MPCRLTMETDIRGATDLGFESILVLTGFSQREMLGEFPFASSRVVSSIAELVPARQRSARMSEMHIG